MSAAAETLALPAEYLDAMAREDFMVFLSLVMAEIEPGTAYVENWHLDLIASRLLKAQRGECLRLIINLPPRSMKTITVSIAYAAWLLGHDPATKIMCVTYSKDIAKAQAGLFARIMRSGWFKRLFPACRSLVHNSVLEWRTSDGGYRLATSIEASVLGRGADYIILDDPNKGQEIFSEVARNKVKAAWDNVISTRLNHPKESRIICVMQRLHEDDLAGHMVEQEDYQVLEIPAIAIEDECWDLGDDRVYRRLEGQSIQPDRMDHRELDRQKGIMGSLAFSAQYQQQPIPSDGVVIRRDWLIYYDELPAEFDYVLASWDTASTLEETSDWSVGTVWGLSDGKIYLLNVIRQKWEFNDLLKVIEETHIEHDVHETLIEAADVGRALIQALRRGKGPCHPNLYNPRIEKVARMQARAVLFETRQVLLPKKAAWLDTYRHELLGFPNVRHDDQVDSTSMALDRLHRVMNRIDPPPRHRARRSKTRRPQPRSRRRDN